MKDRIDKKTFEMLRASTPESRARVFDVVAKLVTHLAFKQGNAAPSPPPVHELNPVQTELFD